MTDDLTRRRAELLAPYTGLIRHVLALPPGADAVAVLRERLAPPQAKERPPVRAPGIARLRAALRALEDGHVPDVPLEQFEEDLHFLQLFAPGATLGADGMRRLLRDVLAEGD